MFPFADEGFESHLCDFLLRIMSRHTQKNL